MSGREAKKINHCLNRLLLTEMKNPDKINPYVILWEFCDFDSLPEMKKLFRECCKVSLSGKYSWKEKSPGNLLFFYEQLERLVEACFLIYIKKGFKKRVSKKPKSRGGKKWINYSEFPCSLSLEEWLNPLIVIKDFFDLYSLLEWKQSIHSWMEAALSDFSVLENIKAEEILPYCYSMEKLLESSYRIVLLSDKK
jgi:hypothetical protein